MLANVRAAMIKPVITAAVAAGALVNTDNHSIHARSPAWSRRHETVCHARDENEDGSREVHVYTIEGFCSLPRSWLHPHRGISPDKLPRYLGFLQFAHDARRRGKGLPAALVAVLSA